MKFGYLDTVKLMDFPLFTESETTGKTFLTLCGHSCNGEIKLNETNNDVTTDNCRTNWEFYLMRYSSA
jgi:hypothetical protein